MSHKNTERFHAILKELGELHDKKQKDYGSDKEPFANLKAAEEFGIPAWLGAVIRLNDKVARIKSLVTKGSLSNESLEDSLKDIAVYGAIALVLFEELNAK